MGSSGSKLKLSAARKAEVYHRVSFIKAREQFAKIVEKSKSATSGDSSNDIGNNNDRLEAIKNAVVGYPMSRNFGVHFKFHFEDSPALTVNIVDVTENTTTTPDAAVPDTTSTQESPVTRFITLSDEELQEFDGSDEKTYVDITLFDLLNLPFHPSYGVSSTSQYSALPLVTSKFFLGLSESQFEFLFPRPFARLS